MQLSVHQLIPVPLKEKILANKSGIWNQTLTFTQGEHIFVRAPSGTGKTTLIHTLYHMRRDHEGVVMWDAHDLNKIDSEVLAKLRSEDVSVIFQDMRLFPELTAWENLDIKRRLTNTVTLEQMEHWMERLGIKEKRNSLGRTLSYGEQQRVAIIRALLQPFKWLLMDEPFSHLDHSNIDKARKLIGEVVAEHKAGLILADLDENDYFHYTKTIAL